MKVNKTLTLICLLLLTGCQEDWNPARDYKSLLSPDKESLVRINGRTLKKSELTALKQELSLQNKVGKITNQEAMEALIRMDILAQEALDIGLHKEPEYAARRLVREKQLLADLSLAHYLSAHPLTEQDIEMEYSKRYTGENRRQYKLRRILVNSEADAKKLIASLQMGAGFIDLAKLSSIAPDAKQGGDLSWLSLVDMELPMAQAVMNLNDGTFTQLPVNTVAGWQIFFRESSRIQDPPSYDTVRQIIYDDLAKDRADNHIKMLMEKSEVIFTDPDFVKNGEP
jgi:peptidyl-prolyl cis-trans isomerase C